MAKVQLKTHLPAIVLFEGEMIDIEVRRMGAEEFIAFEAEHLRFTQPAGADPQVTATAAADALLAHLKASIVRDVRVPAGQIDDRGVDVVTGEQLYAACGAQIETMINIVNQVWAHNRFDEAVRKKLRSPSGSATTSTGQGPEAPGATPDPTAGNAGPLATAPTADVAPTTTASQSGETSA